jgi:hypothetical protein
MNVRKNSSNSSLPTGAYAASQFLRDVKLHGSVESCKPRASGDCETAAACPMQESRARLSAIFAKTKILSLAVCREGISRRVDAKDVVFRKRPHSGFLLSKSRFGTLNTLRLSNACPRRRLYRPRLEKYVRCEKCNWPGLNSIDTRKGCTPQKCNPVRFLTCLAVWRRPACVISIKNNGFSGLE